MFLGIYKLVRMLLKTLRGSETPRQLAIGIALGMLIGLLPKDNLLVVLVGTLIIATNTNVLMASLSAFAFTWIGFSLDPISHRVGHYLLTHESLVPMWTRLYELPLAPWTSFNDTIVCGSLAIGLLSLLPIYQASRLFFAHVAPPIHKRLIKYRAWRMLAGVDAALDAKAGAKAGAGSEATARRRYVRWNWILPRMAIIIVLIGTVYLGKNHAIRFAIEHFGSQMSGAKVDIGRVSSSFADGQFRLHGIEVANPNEPMRNLVQATYAGFDVDTHALLRKKIVIENTKLAGLEFDSAREKSGQLPDIKAASEAGSTEPGFVSQAVSDLSKRWAGEMKDVLGNKLEENLQTVRVSKQLMEYWPREYDLAETRAKQLEQRIRELKELRNLKLDNPLRDLQKYQDALAQLNRTKTEIITLQNQLKQMRRAFDTDRQALIDAKNADQQNIRGLVKNTKLDGDTLTRVLLGPQQGERAAEVLEWVRWVRETVPNPEEDFHPVRGRGTEIIFPGIRQTPDFLVRHIELSGKGTIADDLYQFTGTMENLTSDPKILGKPTVIQLSTLANTDVQIQAVVDQTGVQRIDKLLIHLPDLDISPQQLGSEKSILVSSGPAKGDLQIQLNLIGDRIVGRVTHRQTGLKMSVDKLPGGISDGPIVDNLQQQLDGIESFDVVMKLSGTIDQPKLKFDSDLGDKLASAMNSTLRQTVDQQVAKLSGRIDQIAQEKMSQLNTLVAAKQAEVQHLLDSHGVNIADLQGTVQRGLNLPLLRR